LLFHATEKINLIRFESGGGHQTTAAALLNSHDDEYYDWNPLELNEFMMLRTYVQHGGK